MNDVPDHREPTGDDDDLLAAEYALGVLDAAARRRVERRLDNEPAMRVRVEDWENRLSPMLDAVEPVEAPVAAFAGVERALDRMGRRPAPSPAAAPENLVSRAWKWFGLGSFGLLAASLATLFVATQTRVGEPPLATVIAPNGGAALYAAVIDARTNRATLIPISVPALGNGDRELWAIAPNAEPRSLGVLPAGGPVQIVLPPSLLATGVTLAVSQEPPGGSPTGRPTGPVVGTGELRRI